MFVLKNDQVYDFDVDDTLAMWDIPVGYDGPLTKVEAAYISEIIAPHCAHIKQMRAHKGRGHAVCVWSAGGYAWAEAVVKALGIENLVDIVRCKPQGYYDDIPASEFMGKRMYIPFSWERVS